MNLIILHQHFNTPDKGGGLRSWYIAKALLAKGVDVQVITGSAVREYRVRDLEGIKIHELPVPYNNSFGFFRRSFSFLQYVFSAVRLVGTLPRPKLIYTVSVPLTTGLAAMWIRRRLGVPYVFEVGDLWPDAPVEMGVIRSALLKRWLFHMERSIYARAEALIALSPPIARALIERAPGKEVHMIPNMADTDVFRPSPVPSEHPFTIAYLGALGLANGLEYLIACAESCQRHQLPVRFIIAGAGAMERKLKQTANAARLHNVVFHQFTNREGVVALLNDTDACFVCYKALPILETGSPNKFFDGLSAGKLIITNFKGWIGELIQREQCGVVLPAHSPESIAEIIRPFVNNREKLQGFQFRARELALKAFSRTALTAQLVDALMPLLRDERR